MCSPLSWQRGVPLYNQSGRSEMRWPVALPASLIRRPSPRTTAFHTLSTTLLKRVRFNNTKRQEAARLSRFTRNTLKWKIKGYAGNWGHRDGLGFFHQFTWGFNDMFSIDVAVQYAEICISTKMDINDLMTMRKIWNLSCWPGHFKIIDYAL